MSFSMTCQQCGRTVELRRHPDGPTRRKNCSWRCRADAKRLGWAFIHQGHLEAEEGLLLCGVLITPYVKREGGLTCSQEEAIAAIQSRLVALREEGRLPENDVCWVRPRPFQGAPRVENQTEAWIEHKLATCQCFSLRVPLPVPELA